ncbi:MAG TPA: hypothetical protein VG387_14660 [Rhizomicrobium sp.]|jgi:hypothetical protein|nr:hypothetical protein [Rhizomicrobium sp.]
MEDGEERGTLPGIVIAMILAGAWALAILTRVDDGILRDAAAGDKTSAFALFLGYTILPVAVIWAMLYFAYVRLRAPSQGVFHAMLMFVLVSGIDLGGLALRTGALQTITASPPGGSGDGLASLQAPLQPALPVDTVIANSRANIDIALRPRGGQMYFYANAPGPGGDIDRHIKMLADGLNGFTNATRARLDVLGYPAFMRPQEFQTEAGLAQARARLAEVRAALQSQQADERALVAEYRTWLQTQAPLTAAQRDAALAQLDAAMTDGGASGARYQALMLQQVAEFEAMIRDMRNSRLPWRLLSGKLYFAGDHDLAVFRRHAQSVDAIGRQARAVYAGVN